MRIHFAIPLIGAFGLSLAATSPLQHHQEPTPSKIADAGLMFKKMCASCHVAPDLRFEVDKAWLGQLAQTA